MPTLTEVTPFQVVWDLVVYPILDRSKSGFVHFSMEKITHVFSSYIFSNGSRMPLDFLGAPQGPDGLRGSWERLLETWERQV